MAHSAPPIIFHYKDPNQVTLVATRLPPGKILFATAGHSTNAQQLLTSARSCGDCPEHIEVARAEDVGLELHIKGQRTDWSWDHVQGRFVILTNA